MLFNIPQEEPTYQFNMNQFNGADLMNSALRVGENRSPACPNMIRETPGHNRKRRGYETILDLSAGGKINGIHTFRGGEYSTLGADVCDGGTALKSSESSPTYLAAYAFDNNNTTRWSTASGAATSGVAYIGYQFASAKAIRGFSVYTNDVLIRNMPSVKLQCSDDGSAWSDVATVALDTTISTRTVYPTADGGSHVYWRLLANYTLSGTWVIPEIEFFEMVVTENTTLIHAGTKIYTVNFGTLAATDLSVTMNDGFSKSWQFGGNLYILDGDNYWCYNGTTIAAVTGYIPTIIIGRLYNGGGTLYEPINLITPWRTERFCGDNNSGHKVFQLTATSIDADAVIVKSLQADGSFVTLTLNTDYTVNTAAGTVTFVAVKPTPVTGVDNIYITYAKSIAAYADRIKHCTIGTVYGLNGAKDRLVLSGNPSYRNTQWHSKSNDPTYFGDTYYTLVGRDDSSVIGYSTVNDLLVAHKDSAISGQNAYVFTGELVSSIFTLVATSSYTAEGAYGKNSFASFDNEPMYLTVDKKISAITPQDYSSERFSQERSYYLSTGLKANATSDSYACIWNGFYVLSAGEYLFFLDSMQPVYERNEQYSNRQYEGYYWTGINARVLFSYEGRLYFGDSTGKVKRFFNVDTFTDDGVSTTETVEVDGVDITTELTYRCYWETPEIYGKAPELKKTFKHLAILLASFQFTGCRVWVKIDGVWEVLFDYDTSANFLDFDDIHFDEFTFRTDDTPTLAGGKFKAKNLLHVQFRFENSKNQPFGIYMAILKYIINNEFIK